MGKRYVRKYHKKDDLYEFIPRDSWGWKDWVKCILLVLFCVWLIMLAYNTISLLLLVNEMNNLREEIAEKVYGTNTPTDTIVCSTDYYNCADFSTCSEAKEVFFKCGSSSDIHYLDADNDGIPCERYQGSGLC